MRIHANHVVTVLALLGCQLFAQTKPPITPQASRGKELFTNSPKGAACANCHAMAGVGTAVGPDLTRMASLATPPGLAMAMRWTMTEVVQDVKAGPLAFPGVLKEKQGQTLHIWDLSQIPPVLRQLQATQVQSMTRNTTWMHPATISGYNSQELADIIAFLRWAAIGDTKEVKPIQ